MRSLVSISHHSVKLTTSTHDHVSPGDEPPPERPAVALFFSVPVPRLRKRASSVHSSRTSRSASLALKTSNVSEKMVVFKDDATVDTKYAALHTRSKATPHYTKPERRKHLRAVSESAVSQGDSTPQRAARPIPDENLHGHGEVSAGQRLQDIATLRTELLRQLAELQHEEDEVLKSLSTSTLEQPLLQDPVARPTSIAHRALTLHLPTPSIVPRLQPSKTNREAPSARPVFAPPETTPSTTRLFTLFTSRRIPLAVRTTEILLIVDPYPLSIRGTGCLFHARQS
jgi:hypothetical protein